jgi:hypothetical protein
MDQLENTRKTRKVRSNRAEEVKMSTMRRQGKWLGLWMLGCFVACASATAALGSATVDSETANERPNILLMIADDMSMKDWGVYGNKFVKTPHIDKLAREGVRFTNAYCNSPACHPARSSLLTGQEI